MPKVRNDDRQERQERQAAQREAAARKKRNKRLLSRGAWVLVLLGAAAVAYGSYTGRQWVEAVRTATYPAGMHAAGRVNYLEDPPLGGTHNATWQNCGIYDAPVHKEHAVHSLEHGAVWITYRPDLPAEQVQRLKSVAADDFLLLSPYPGLSSPVVVSAWNNQLPLDGADDSRLEKFIARYKNNPQTTPEFGAPCAGGTSGTDAADTLGAAPLGPVR